MFRITDRVPGLRSELTYTLVKLDKDYAAASAEERWEDWYAARLIDRFG